MSLNGHGGGGRAGGGGGREEEEKKRMKMRRKWCGRVVVVWRRLDVCVWPLHKGQYIAQSLRLVLHGPLPAH